MRKPDREIYELTCARMNIMPNEAVFLDDNAENIAAARAFGMKAVHVVDPEIALAELELILTRQGSG
jgi:FMN phosphatase YigB (HAD superfamily)